MIALLGDFWLRIEVRLESGRSRKIFPALQYLVLVMKTIARREPAQCAERVRAR
jgi:hypothetical protein